MTRASAASTCARGALSRRSSPEHGQRVDPARRLAAPAVQRIEAVVVRVCRIGGHRRDVAQPPVDLLAQPGLEPHGVDDALSNEELPVEDGRRNAHVLELGQRAVEDLAREVPELHEHLTEEGDRLVHARLGGLAAHEEHRHHAPVRRRHLDRSAELLLEGVDQKMEKGRLAKRAARCRRRSVRGEVAHVAAGKSEVSVWGVPTRACKLLPRLTDSSQNADGCAAAWPGCGRPRRRR